MGQISEKSFASGSAYSEEEWAARVDLAVCYRLVAHFGWTHLIHNHITLRVPGTTDQFLINPFGLLYEQITASNLIKIDVDGNRLQESEYDVNRAGFVIHSAIHMARPDLHAVIHTHTVAGQAISALDCGILPLNQSALRFYNRVGYHDHEGISDDLSERDRIVADLGAHKVLILKNHGLLTAGVNLAEAFHLMYHLEKCSQTQMMVLAANQPYSTSAPEVCEKAAAQHYRGNRALGQNEWPALKSLMLSKHPDLAD